MAAVTICSDFGAQKNKVWHCFHCFPIYFPWSDGTRSLFSECWVLRTTIWPSNSIPGMYMCIYIYVDSSIIYKIWRQHKCLPTDEWSNWICGIHTHTHNAILLIHKKEWNFAICNNTDGLGEFFAKWNKSDRERQILYDTTYTWNLKTTIN